MPRITLSDADFDALDRQQGEQRVRAAGLTAPQVAPDQLGAADRIASKRGLPSVVVADNLGEYEAQEHTDAVLEASRTNPALGNFLSNPVHQGLSRDDLPALRGVAKAADPAQRKSYFGVLVGNLFGFGAGDVADTVSERFVAADTGLLANTIQAGSEALETIDPNVAVARLAGMARKDALLRGDAKEAEQFTKMQAAYEDPIGYRAAGRQAALVGQETRSEQQALRAQASRPKGVLDALSNPSNTAKYYGGMIADSMPAMLASIAARRPVAGAVIAGEATGAAQFSESRGEGKDKFTSLKEALPQGAIEAVGSFIPLSEAFGGQARRVITTPLAEGVSEAVTEIAQTDVQDALTGEKTADKEKFLQALDAFFVGSAMGVAEAAGGTAPPPTETVRKWISGARAAQDKTYLDGIMQQAADSKLRTRSPGKFQDFVQGQVGDAMVYVPAESLQMLFQGAGIDPGSAVAELTGSPDAWSEALAAGTPVAIPMSRYVTHMADSHAQIADQVRITPDLDTDVEPRVLSREELQADIEAALAEGATVDNEAARQGTVFNDFYGQLLGAGVEENTAAQQALAAQSVFRTWESRFGLEPDTLANRYQFNINRPQTALGAARDVDARLDPVIEQVRAQRAGKTPAMEFKADNLASRVVALGGIDPESVGAGDLKGIVRPGLLNKSGITVEAAAEALANDGLGDLFTTRDEFGRPDYRELLEMLADEDAGVRTFVDPSRSESELAAVENQGNVDTVTALLERLEGQGVAVDDLSVPELRALLEPLLNEDDVSGGTAPSGMFYQDAVPDGPTYEQLVAEVARLNNLLRVDPLTGLRNRFAFDEDANLGWATVAVIDLDGLKNLNDNIGHAAGDALLKAAGGVMLAAESDGVRFYRQGGDEYAVRIRDTDAAGPLLQEVIDRMESADLTLTVDGIDYLYQGIGAGYGIGQTFDEADEKQKQDKQRRTDAGLRERRGADGTPRRLRQLPGEQGGGRREGEGAQPEGLTPEEMLSQGGTAPRGGILGSNGNSIIGDKPGPDGRRVFNISLFAGMNYSTFLHENAHAFLEVFGDLAEADGAPQQVKDDWAKALAFMGVDNRGAIGRDQHELWARAGEAYLREGRAPSPSLRRTFASFKVWLTGIYRTATALRVELTDEVRGVFDRMYATDAEIAEARQQQAIGPMFRHGETIGMTPEQEQAYWNAVDAAQADAESVLASEVLVAQQRAAKAFLSAEKRKVQEQVEAATRELRPYRALRWLRQGQLPDGSSVPIPIKLDRQALLDAGYLPAFMQRHLSGLYSKTGGVTLETAADLLGYGGGAEMIQELVAAPPLWDVIRADTARIMAERYPDPLVDGSLVDRAMAAVHSEKQAEAMLLGVQALERHVDGRVRSQGHVLPEVARRIIAAKRARDLQPNTYRLAEGKAGREALAAAAKQDWPAAASAARKQLLAHHLYSEARRARGEVDAAQKYLRRQGEKNARQKLGKAGNYLTRDGSYLDQVDGILERYDLKPMSGAAADRRASLASWIEAQTAAGFEVAIPDSVRNEAQRLPFRELSVEQVRDVRDAVKHIVALANLRNKLLLAADGRTLEVNVTDLVDTAKANHKVEPEAMDLSPSFTRRFGDWLSRIDAALLKPEFLFTWMDGEKANGAFWRKLFQPFVDAEAAEVRRMAEASAALRVLFKGYQRGKLSTQRVYVDAAKTRKFAGNFTRESLIAVGLNMGNEYNRQAMMEGFDWTDAQLQAVAAQLTEHDWDTVAGVWKLYETLRPDVFALEKAMTGLEPEQVEAAPFMTPNGRMMAGGYHPVKFDAGFSFRAFQRDAKQSVQDQYGGSYSKATTKKGHLQARKGTGGQPIKLSLSVVSEHMTNVIHDITHRRALFDVQRLVDHPDVRGVIEATAGRHAYRSINPWLVRLGSDPAIDINPLEQMIRRARVGATVVNMGFKITTAIVQPLGYFQTIEVAGPKAAAVGLAEFTKNPKRALRFAMERSQVLPHRMQSYDRDVRDSLSRVTSGGLRDDVQRSFFMLTGLTDMAVVIPTWLGAYHKAIGGDQPGVDAGNEVDAIAYADGVVRQSQSSGSPKDLATIQRGNETFKAFTMFYSYFSVLYNLGRRSIRRTKSTKDLPRLAASAFYLWFVPSVLSEIIAGRGPEDDEEWSDWIFSKGLKSFLTYPFQVVPIVRDVVNGFASPFGYSPSPAFDAFEATVGTVQTTTKAGKILIGKVTGNESDEEIKRSEIKRAVMAAGYWGHLPSRQAWITGSYLYDLAVGNEQPENIGDVFNGIAFSRPEPKE